MEKITGKKVRTQWLYGGRSFLWMLLCVGVVLTVVYCTGRANHRALYRNALISTALLSALFFCILTTVALYKGWRLYNNVTFLGKRPTFFNFKNIKNWMPSYFPDIPDGEMLSLLIILTVVFVIIPAMLWIATELAGVLFFFTLVLTYGLFYRALKLILRNAGQCKDSLSRSLLMSFAYTIGYAGCIYSVIFAGHFLACFIQA